MIAAGLRNRYTRICSPLRKSDAKTGETGMFNAGPLCLLRRIHPSGLSYASGDNVSDPSSATPLLASHCGAFIPGGAIVKPAAASGGGLQGPVARNDTWRWMQPQRVSAYVCATPGV